MVPAVPGIKPGPFAADIPTETMRYVLLLIVAGVAGFAFVNYERGSDAVKDFSTIASEIARRPVEVRCPSVVKRLVDINGESGRVEFDENGRPGDHADLSGDACGGLEQFKSFVANEGLACLTEGQTCEDEKLEQMALAVHTLSHESYHLAGFKDEAIAECYAMQTNTWTAVQLGAPTDQAQALARYYIRTLYPDVPSEYRSRECKIGGRLDLGRGWP